MQRKTQRYVDSLPEVSKSYNHTAHSSLGRTPASTNESNEHESRYEHYVIRQTRTARRPICVKKEANQRKNRRYAFKLGHVVRVTHIRNVFDREYSQKRTGELFKVTRRFRREELPVYKIEDWSGENIKGTFYKQELQAVNVDDNTEFYIEKIWKKRIRRKR